MKKTSSNQTLYILFYAILILALVFYFIPCFRIDLRTKPSSEHIYVYQSVFILGFPKYTHSYLFTVVSYIPLISIIVVIIPFINRFFILTNILLGTALLACLNEIVFINNRETYGLLLLFILVIAAIYNLRFFINKKAPTS